MAGVKQAVSFDLQQDALRMLESAAEKYGLPDKSKALRVLIRLCRLEPGAVGRDFRSSALHRCGGRPGWTG